MQEKETYEEKNTSAGFDLSWDMNLGKFSKPSIGLSASRGTIDSAYRSARGQSGIFAGKGGFDIYVEKNTDLKGAIIASEATAGKNRLSTGTFSFSDLENEADYNSKSIDAEYHHYGNYDKMGRQEKNKVYNTIGLSPSLSMPAKGDANSTTTSAVAPGTIDIRENPTQDISALNRDTNNALNELGRIFDKQKIEEQQELAKAFGEEAFRLAHNLPDDGSGRKVAVHAIIGGIMSQITSAGFTSGAIGAGVNEAIIGEIKKIKDPGTAQIVSAIVGAAAAKAVSGNAGAGATSAASGTKNNLYEEVPAIREQLRPLLEPKTYQTLKDFEYQVLFAEENGKKIAVAIDNRGRVWDLDVLEDTSTGLEKFKFHDKTLNAQPATFVIFKYNDYALREYPLDKTDEKIVFRKGAYDGKIADIFSFDVGFIKGCAKSAVAMIDGFIEFVNHPIQSLEVINSFMQLLRTDPEFRKAVGAQATAFFERKYKQLNEGDKHQQGEIAGEVFTEIITLPIPGSKLTKSVKGIEFTSKISNLFGKTAHASSASKIVARDIGKVGENTAKIHMQDGKLLPNIRYQAGEFDYFYETDHLGRLKEFKTDNLQLTERTERLKHNPDTPGKLSTDHSGHLAADRFGGSPELDNLVSQSAKVNLSEYRKLENRWAQAIQEGKNVKVEVKVLYRMDDLRPSGFDVRYEIDGRKFHQNISQ